MAKALRPGLWLPAQVTFSAPSSAPSPSESFATGYQDALLLLRIRYGEACWPHLRLLFHAIGPATGTISAISRRCQCPQPDSMRCAMP
nr:hypothetical protein PJ912_00800 [Pectobacterium colocasium]